MRLPRSSGRASGDVRGSLLVAIGLAAQAATTYVTLILAGRLLGAGQFADLSALYVLLSSVATGLFLPLEQEVARRLGAARITGRSERGLGLRSAVVGLVAAIVVGAGGAALPGVRLVLGGDGQLVLAFVVGLTGYASCFVSRGVLAGTARYSRYAWQLAVEGGFRLVGVGLLVALAVPDQQLIGWLFGAAPWAALAATLWRPEPSRPEVKAAPQITARSLGRPLALLLVSSLTAQLLINAGPVVVQLFAPGTARAGAFLAALLLVRVPVLLFTAVQPSFLPSMSARASGESRSEFVRPLRRLLVGSVAVSVISAVLFALLGPWLVRLLFGFTDVPGRAVLLVVGISVGLFLLVTVCAQALLALGDHVGVATGWLVGLVGLIVGTTLPDDAVNRAVVGFLVGALVALVVSGLLLVRRVRGHRFDGTDGVGPHGRTVEDAG